MSYSNAAGKSEVHTGSHQTSAFVQTPIYIATTKSAAYTNGLYRDKDKDSTEKNGSAITLREKATMQMGRGGPRCAALLTPPPR